MYSIERGQRTPEGRCLPMARRISHTISWTTSWTERWTPTNQHCLRLAAFRPAAMKILTASVVRYCYIYTVVLLIVRPSPPKETTACLNNSQEIDGGSHHRPGPTSRRGTFRRPQVCRYHTCRFVGIIPTHADGIKIAAKQTVPISTVVLYC